MAASRSCRQYCILLLIVALLVVIVQVLLISTFVRIPDTKRGVSRSDTVVITEISTIWCRDEVVRAPYPFETYIVKDYPAIDSNNITKHNFHISKKLGWSDFLYHRAYLLSGSSIRVSSSSSEPGAYLYVIKANEKFEECLKKMAEKVPRASQGKDSSEENDSSSEEYVDHNPIKRAETLHKAGIVKQGMSVSSFFANCPHVFLGKKAIPVSLNLINQTSEYGNITDSNSTEIPQFEQPTKHVDIEVNETSTGYYYIVVDNYNFVGINNIETDITLLRSHYDLKPAKRWCSAKEKCVVHLTFGMKEALVIRVPDMPKYPGNRMFEISSSCKQRVSFYFFLFLVPPLLVGCFSVCLYRMTLQKIQIQKHLVIPGTDTTENVWVDLETSKSPLLIKKTKIKWPSYTNIFSSSRKEKRLSQKCPQRNDGFAPLEVRFDTISLPKDTTSLPSYEEVVVFDRTFHDTVTGQKKHASINGKKE